MNKLVNHPLFHKPTEIKGVLYGVASQEGNDGPDYDLMVQADEYIHQLECHLMALDQQGRDGPSIFIEFID